MAASTDRVTLPNSLPQTHFPSNHVTQQRGRIRVPSICGSAIMHGERGRISPSPLIIRLCRHRQLQMGHRFGVIKPQGFIQMNRGRVLTPGSYLHPMHRFSL